MPDLIAPSLEIAALPDGKRSVVLSGAWTLKALARLPSSFLQRIDDLSAAKAGRGIRWDCLGLTALDSAGALLLWRTWGHSMPESLLASAEHLHVFERIAAATMAPAAAPAPATALDAIVFVGSLGLQWWRHLVDVTMLVGGLLLDLLYLARRPRDIPWREFSANLYKSGVRAMPVTALVGFLIGVVLSYLSSLQLRQFGADVFIVNILGVGVIRELGPVLVAVLVAGRSGSAMTAQLGVMRVTEEIDALAVMGVPLSLRLLLPKVAALAVATPLLVLWASAIALIGSMVTAQIELDLAPGFFFTSLARVVPVANLWIALEKGIVFGALVGLLACHFGLRVRPNTESLSANTTASVVTSITVVILVDALFAIATQHIGLE